MNDYLDPPATAEEQAELLTRAGFPLEAREEVELPGGKRDVRQDIELTSNRGDCLCHAGLAREICAVSGRTLKLPGAAITATGPAASSIAAVENREPELCPLYTARVIRGVKVGRSPDWLAERLIARGDIPRNNIVDASNFVLFELGQPTHVFDLAKLKGSRIVIRMAKPSEPFLPIGEGAVEVKLTERDLAIADGERAVAIAGVKGGALTAVSETTRDILIEAASFAPAAVRATSRRHAIASDSSYRFERGVHLGQIEVAANRLTQLILELCGGELCHGVISAGKPIPERYKVAMRCARCRAILGIDVADQRMVELLRQLDFSPALRDGIINCIVPYPRLDIEREIDLIEEVGRLVGHDSIPIVETLRVRVAPPQPAELARRAVSDALVGMGYLETVTHSLVNESAAAAFLPPGMAALRIQDERGRAEAVLRPSLLPSLLRVCAINRDAGQLDVKLFECGSTFARMNGNHLERANIGLLQPAADDQGVREVRGVINRLVQLLLGPDAEIDVEAQDLLKWFAPGAVARLNGEVLGVFGVLAPDVTQQFGLSGALLGAELGLPALYETYPPETEVRPLPSFPAIERDISAIIDERITWKEVRSALASRALRHLEAIEFITAFRGKQIGAGRKSLTLRARFRAPDGTLKHEQVDPQVQALIAALKSDFAAEIRT